MIKSFPVIRHIVPVLLLIFTFSGCSRQNSEIKQAVKDQLQLYPESTLLDIYKSFFQDEFGPGHMLGNISHAREYFDLELEEMVSRKRYDAEPCGAGKNFYRVPMDLVKDGIIQDEVYFNAFIESSAHFKTPDIVLWKSTWNEILSTVEQMDLQIPNFDRDKKIIAELIDKGEPMVHHSNSYNDSYDPHYRIMSITVWESLKPKPE